MGLLGIAIQPLQIFLGIFSVKYTYAHAYTHGKCTFSFSVTLKIVSLLLCGVIMIKFLP